MRRSVLAGVSLMLLALGLTACSNDAAAESSLADEGVTAEPLSTPSASGDVAACEAASVVYLSWAEDETDFLSLSHGLSRAASLATEGGVKAALADAAAAAASVGEAQAIEEEGVAGPMDNLDAVLDFIKAWEGAAEPCVTARSPLPAA